MKKKYRMMATGILCFCLLLLAANSTVIAQDDDYWGDLAVGDKIQWEVSGILNGVQVDADLEVRILEITGKILRVNMTISGLAGGFYGFTEEESKLVYEDDISPWILPASKIHNVGGKDYEWQGNTYDAVYYYNSDSDGHVEIWVDKGTGIMFALDYESNSNNVDATAKLQWTNASLKTKGCLGTIFIALFTVVSLVSYSAIKIKKKK
ncbi:MAG: hypothetical protein ACFFCD_13615 [Promethearchaeota archaeon]